MTEPVEKTYYMRVYERCPICEGRGYERWPPRNIVNDTCQRCGGPGYLKVYIPIAEWAALTRERVLNIPRNPRPVIDSVVTKGCL